MELSLKGRVIYEQLSASSDTATHFSMYKKLGMMRCLVRCSLSYC